MRSMAIGHRQRVCQTFNIILQGWDAGTDLALVRRGAGELINLHLQCAKTLFDTAAQILGRVKEIHALLLTQINSCSPLRRREQE